MLKIKDNVDLKELKEILPDEKFFMKSDIYDNENLIVYGHFKLTKNKHIIPLNGAGSSRFDIIYDLIQARFSRKSRKGVEYGN